MIHVVRGGDTLYKISKYYGLTINEIVKINQLDNPDFLVIGQAIVIPEAQYHTVMPGESLWSISYGYRVTLWDLIRENKIVNPNIIFPGQKLIIPKTFIETNGYLTQTGLSGNEIIENTAEYLSYMSMFSYKIEPDGNLTEINDTSVLGLALKEDTVPLITITNFLGRKFSSDLANAVLSDTNIQNRLLENILKIMNEKGYKGLNIDFEYVYPYDRKYYNEFLIKAGDIMHSNGYLISSALAPKETENQRGLLYEAHDYKVHGQVDDFVVLMTYEWGYAAGPPWAIAPINKVKLILDYAVTAIPRKKILMGMPLYGRDWKLPYVKGTIARTITPKGALNQAIKYKVPILYDSLYESPYYNYTDENGIKHVVWFEDARSYQVKYNTIKEYALRGASYWELNNNSPQNWPILENNFRIKRLL